MKVRADYVTNSSSSSFMLMIRIGLKNGKTLKFSGDGGVGEGDERFYELTVNESPEKLGTCGSIEELIRMLKRSVTQGGTYYGEDEEPEDPVLEDDDDLIEGLRELDSMDEISTITINGDLFGRGDQYQYKHYTYYRDKKVTAYDEGGVEYLIDEGTGGSIGFYVPQKWKKTDGFGKAIIEEYDYYDEDVALPGEKKKKKTKEKSGSFVIKDGVLKKYKGDLKEVIIPEGVERIASGAFYDNDAMRSVIVPDGVKYIEDFVFCGYNLRKIFLPSSIETLGKNSITETMYPIRIIAPKDVIARFKDKVPHAFVDSENAVDDEEDEDF